MGLFDFFKKPKASKATEENLSPEQLKNKLIKEQVVKAHQGLSGLTDDDIYYLNYLLGLKFFEDAVEYVFKFKQERNAVANASATEALAMLQPIYDAIMHERNRPLPQLSDAELKALAVQFLDKFDIKAELFLDKKILKEDPKIPYWTIPAQLLPPSSSRGRQVEILISAKTSEILQLK